MDKGHDIETNGLRLEFNNVGKKSPPPSFSAKPFRSQAYNCTAHVGEKYLIRRRVRVGKEKKGKKMEERELKDSKRRRWKIQKKEIRKREQL
jgi:hypothetical protein